MIILDPASAVPPFEQVRAHLADAVASGVLTPGDRLPTVRRLADDLALAPGTIARAYRELESAGLIHTRGRHGTFVAAALPAEEHPTAAQRAAEAFAAQMRALGVAPDRALTLAAAALHP